MPSFARDGIPAALPGADWPARWIGGTLGGAPTAGPYATGDFVVDIYGKVFICSAGGSPGTWRQMGGQLAATSAVTVTAAAFTNLASYTVPGADAQAGSIYQFTMFGYGTWGSTQQALSLQPQLGGVTIGSAQVIDATVFAISAAFRWNAAVWLEVNAPGASGSWNVGWQFNATQITNNIIPGTAANNTVGVSSGNGSAAITADSTVSEALTFQAKWAATTGAPTITCRTAWPVRVA